MADDSIVILDETPSTNGSTNRPITTSNNYQHRERTYSESDDDDALDFAEPPKLKDSDDDSDDPYRSIFTQNRKIGTTTINKKKSTNDEKAEKAEKRAETKALKLAQQLERKAIAERKKQDRLDQRAAKEAEKLAKKQHLQITRARQPKSLIKSIMITIDERIRSLATNSVVFEQRVGENLLDENEPVAVEFVRSDIPYSITWKLPEMFDELGEREPILPSTDLVMAMPVVDVVNLVDGWLKKDADGDTNLLTHFERIKAKTGKKIVLIIVGLHGYLQNYKTLRNRQHRRQYLGDDSSDATTSTTMTKGLKAFDGLRSIIDPDDIDRALVDLQMTADVPHMNASDSAELAQLLQHFTKALVEKPEKKRKLQAQAAIGWQELGGGGSNKAAKVGEDGSGRRELWKRMILQTGNRLDPPFADGVVEKFGNPLTLAEAYRRCPSADVAKNLLIDVDTSGHRRPEASRRVHMAFTCRDPDQLINRDK